MSDSALYVVVLATTVPVSRVNMSVKGPKPLTIHLSHFYKFISKQRHNFKRRIESLKHGCLSAIKLMKFQFNCRWKQF